VAPRLLFVLAHPDDESMGFGGTVVRHARAGVEVHLLCLTRGGAGWGGRPPGRRPEELPEIRSEELRAAADVLGLASVELWDYPDGGVPAADQAEIAGRIRDHTMALRPGVVAGWGPDGGYFHPDHIACGACTDEALAGAGIPLYHAAFTPYAMDGYRRLIALSGQDPSQMKSCEWGRTSVSFRLQAGELSTKMRAIACHVSQLDEGWDKQVHGLVDLPGFEIESFIRVRDTNPQDLVTESGLFPELSKSS
jgi:LmbE family N-acetylglucosaminyl deacetylase